MFVLVASISKGDIKVIGTLKMKGKMLIKYSLVCFFTIYSSFLLAATINGPLITDMAQIGGAPPLCSIQASDNEHKQLCSATLIDKKHIITAAHCIDDMIPGKTKILCSYDFSNKKFKEIFELKSMYKPEQYKGPKIFEPSTVSVFDFGVAELDGQSTLTPMKTLDDLKYLTKIIKDEKKYVYVVKQGGLRLFQDDIRCYISGYASGQLDIAELKTWAHNAERVVDQSNNNKWKISEWAEKSKKSFDDKFDEPQSYSLVTVENVKKGSFPIDKLAHQEQEEIRELTFKQETIALGEDASKDFPSIDLGDSGGALFCKRYKETHWLLVGVASMRTGIIKDGTFSNKWALIGTLEFEKMITGSGYKIDKSLKYYGEK